MTEQSQDEELATLTARVAQVEEEKDAAQQRIVDLEAELAREREEG